MDDVDSPLLSQLSSPFPISSSEIEYHPDDPHLRGPHHRRHHNHNHNHRSTLHRARTAPAITILHSAAAAPSADPSAASSSNSVLSSAALLLLAYLSLGVIVYSLNPEGYSGVETHPAVDALYFCIVTLCTIGYGDIAPLTPLTKILSCAFVLVGFGIIDVLLSGAVSYVLDVQENIIMARSRDGAGAVSYIIDAEKGRMRIRMKVGLAVGVVILCIGAGTLALYHIEHLDWMDSFYLSVMSVTTVGYGDRAFKTMEGRVFASFWLLVSTLAVARAFLYLAEARINKRHRRIAKWVLQRDLTVEDLFAADINHSGFIRISPLKEKQMKNNKNINLAFKAKHSGSPPITQSYIDLHNLDNHPSRTTLFPAMAFTVTKSSQSMVRPASSTPAGTLDLSTIDRLPGLNAKVRTYHVFRGPAHEPAKVIREALSKALVHYYPLAGRLVQSSKGELQVKCNAQGAWFIDASASCSLKDINHLSHPLVPMHDQLLPDPQPEADPSEILVLMQVTQFTCGGFVIGLESSHTVFDGLGSAQFLNCVAEFARGLKSPTVEPVWYREAIPKPPGIVYVPLDSAAPPFPMPSYKLEQAIVDVSLDDISSIKSQFFELTGQWCSMFDILAARVWQCRTLAIKLDPNVQVKLVFFANVRPLVHPPLPAGFYGNCFFPVTVMVSSGRLVSASSVEVVELIREAKAKLPVEFARWAAGEGEDPYIPSLGYTTLFMSEWSRLGFKEVNYGWGMPIQVVPLTYSDLIPVCILGSPPAPRTGARLIAQCVEEEHLAAFQDHMMRHAQ